MNKGIAHILMNELKTLPFIDLYGGMVQTVEQLDTKVDEETGAERTFTQLYPATVDYYVASECGTGDLKDCSPDSKYNGILFFEDNGTDPNGRNGKLMAYTSKLRLVCWLNTNGIRKDLTEDNEIDSYNLPVMMMAAIAGKMEGLRMKNKGYYLKLNVKERSILSQDKNIFSRYNFDTAATQLLLPPYEFFAIDYSIEFSMSPNCIVHLKRVSTSC